MSILTELLRDNFRNSRIKLAILPTLGEALHYIASQEEVKGQAVDNWTINQMTYTLIIRCLREGVSTNSLFVRNLHLDDTFNPQFTQTGLRMLPSGCEFHSQVDCNG